MVFAFKWIVILLMEVIFSPTRHAVKSILSEDGDIIDCMDIYKQPAFSHPALKNHTIQMTPTYDPIREKSKMETKSGEGNENLEPTVTSQLWHRKGITCPKGTIPIRRIQRKKKGFPFHNFGRKKPNYHAMQVNGTQNLNRPNRSAASLITDGFSYSGAKGDIRVWNPYVGFPDEYSTSHVSLRNNLLEVESGWAVNPSVYGDHRTRFFIYWTTDASNTTGCFDLTCPGFVQTNSEIALGAAIGPITTPRDLPYKITVYIYKDRRTHNWWVQFGETMDIGYWPAELFNPLFYHAIVVVWGGEVYSSRVGGFQPHTATAMGSGHFADYIFETSGAIKRMRVEENGHELKFPEFVWGYSDEFDCYDQFYVGDYIEDPEFYYGGPGRNPRCH